MFSSWTMLAGVGLAAAASPFASTCPVDVPLSCNNQTAYEDSCCMEYPGGQVLLTQFWDTDPSTGPEDSWTIHGLWPDNCDGTWEEYCDPSREVFNITEILRDTAPCTLSYMQDFWKDYQGDDEDFWEHEFNKHGTCMTTLEPGCYSDFSVRYDVIDYFKRTVKLHRSLPSFEWLAEAGIMPSLTATYTYQQIQDVLVAKHGHEVIINCDRNGELNELWYHYNIRGSIQAGEFVPAAPVGSPSSCKATGIKYLPKYTPQPDPTTTTSIPIPTGAPGQLSGKGRLYVSTDASSTSGFLISGGTWYRGGGTPATYTARPNVDGTTFSLTTSKGLCIVQDDALTCAESVSEGSAFGYDGAYLTYESANTFYAEALPTGQVQGTVYVVPKAVSFKASWTST